MLLSELVNGFKYSTVEIGKILAIMWIVSAFLQPPQTLVFVLVGIIYYSAAISLQDTLQEEARIRRLRKFNEQ